MVQKNGRDVRSSDTLSPWTFDDSSFASPDILIAFIDPSIEEVFLTRSWIAWFHACWSLPMFFDTNVCPAAQTT